VIRDTALYVSGLLNMQVGGPGVKPYQPSGLWKAIAYPTSSTANFKQDKGKAIYRRSIYTFLKRTSPPPNMSSLDSPNRESCIVRRERTNTPLQALVLMNDIQFVEAARHLAERAADEAGTFEKDQLRYMFHLVTSRTPDSEEVEVLSELHASYLKDYTEAPEKAVELIQTGDSPSPSSDRAPKLAALTMIANLILNLDETITLN
jgi:hypothetical protein